MKSPFNARRGRRKVLAALLIVVAATIESHPAWAQGNLFGGPRPVVIGGTQSERAANRRVVVVIHAPDPTAK